MLQSAISLHIGKNFCDRTSDPHMKVQRQREDFAKKTANAYVRSCDLIAYEDLQIKNMVRNRKLSKSIHDAGWGMFLQWVKRYGALHEIEIVAVPPHYTTQNCSGCGTKVQKSLSVKLYLLKLCFKKNIFTNPHLP